MRVQGKNPPFNSLVWSSLRLAPIIINQHGKRCYAPFWWSKLPVVTVCYITCCWYQSTLRAMPQTCAVVNCRNRSTKEDNSFSLFFTSWKTKDFLGWLFARSVFAVHYYTVLISIASLSSMWCTMTTGNFDHQNGRKLRLPCWLMIIIK